MGLDAWLMAKTKIHDNENSATGVCSGLFGIVPTAVSDAVELCYLRKGYDQNLFIWDYGFKKDGDDENTLHFSKEDIEEMLAESKIILSTHKFDEEDGNDLTDDTEYTWLSKTKWESLIKGLEKALDILKEDSDADIYYHIWF